GEANQLWMNQGNGTFVDEAFLLGAALDGQGHAEAGMGIALGDVDSDSDLDLFVTHIVNEMNTLFVNGGALGFDDRTTASGLGAVSLSFTGFGVGFFDFDHDADLDVAVANGRILRRSGASPSGFWAGYAERNQIAENDGKGKFRDAVDAAGDFGKPVEVSRGLAFGDYDGDGDIDLLVQNAAARARIYRNDAPKEGDWLMVRAFEPEAKRDAHGARVTVSGGGKRFVRLANPGYGYFSSHDPRAHFGLPEGVKVDSVEILWPDGTRESFPAVETNRAITLSKGSGSRR
ncbi:MAG: ASPIC/UnbV domain-containing protein, partial [Vicinamibacteria bacterium]